MADIDIAVDHLGGDRWVIALRGEHDLSTIPRVQTALNRVFETGTCLVIDLTQTTFIDSSVIRTLLAAHQRALTINGEALAIVAPPNSFAARVIDLVGLHNHLPIYQTKDTALQAITPH